MWPTRIHIQIFFSRVVLPSLSMHVKIEVIIEWYSTLYSIILSCQKEAS